MTCTNRNTSINRWKANYAYENGYGTNNFGHRPRIKKMKEKQEA